MADEQQAAEEAQETNLLNLDTPEDAPEDAGDEIERDAEAQETVSVKPDENGIIEYNGDKIKVPPELIDQQTGEINGAAAVKRAIDLRKLVGKTDKVEAPENYDFTVPEDLKEVVGVNADSPLAASAIDAAKKAGLSQEQFDGMVQVYLQNVADEASNAPAPVDQQVELQKVYGEQTQATVERLNKTIPAMFPEMKKDEGVRAIIEGVASTAQGVQFLDMIASKMKEPIPSPKGGVDSAPVSRDALMDLMRSEAYFNSSHPDHNRITRQVTEGYAKLQG